MYYKWFLNSTAAQRSPGIFILGLLAITAPKRPAAVIPSVSIA
ncbi:hypothetical protein [Paenibacillus alvei]|nr:hypothetical protein [Paenibacillus alvei]